MLVAQRMTLDGAIDEAQRRWKVHGGWAEESQDDAGVHCRVGIRTNDGFGSRQVCLGYAKSFEKAFAAADKHLSRARRPPKAKPEIGFPTVELFDPPPP